jgi:formate C-acetyltransferase
LCHERAALLTASWRESEGKPRVVRRALALAKVLREMSIYVQPGDLIVGNQASQPRAAPVFPEYSVDWLVEELPELPKRSIDRFAVSAETSRQLIEICQYWRGDTYQDRARAIIELSLPEDVRSAFDIRYSNLNQVSCNLWKLGSGDGHIVVDYERVMRIGLLRIGEETRKLRDKLDMTQAENLEKRIFYEAVLISLQAAIDFAGRFAALAEQLAGAEPDSVRRGELLTIAEMCRWVPAHPARNFWEAVQSYWFVHLLIQIEANGHSISPGRFDQYLYPYYRTDLATGRLSRAQAQELVECFWIKCNELNKVREWVPTQYFSGYPLFQTVTLGGQARNGRDAVNDLTYVCLDATAVLKLPQPTVIVRVHDGSPDEFLMEAARCLLRHGGGMPGFFSDEVAIPLLMRLGVTLEEARDWCVMGCAEPQVAGRFNTGTGGASHTNILKVLEIALNGGTNPRTGLCPCPGEGDLKTFRYFDEVMAAFQRQLAYYMRALPLMDNATSLAFAEMTPTPLLSALVDGRVQRGKDVSLGGPPNYHNLVQHAWGLANVVNSLAALKKLVYEEGRLSGSELAQALADDFAGPRGEEIRHMLLHRAPKYGNDDDEVDLLAREVVDMLAGEAQKYQPLRGGCFGLSTQSLSSNVPAGAQVGATPDGRRAGEPLADNNSPAPGSDLCGPTAALKSVAKFDHALLSNGTILNLKFHPSALQGEERLRKFVALLRTYFDLKGFQVQFNIISPEVLREAQREPDKYRNLVVKVAGYSALFSSLDRKLQDQIIERTTHQVP